ncbi:nuclear transport factor 2 family protein [Nocardioides acrostichi]|uniref:Nuclear transport factor 2 family protein n=1 Tax=Nocardioides acrostichi TaxID=2784339 RepID=A0A930Y8M9_9ACTN|nr:nuclear transport factor 2 family protein [Nocardioides acrostichi]MBF4163282.1 nuclear transport factor 2 family protein [Nocardioides acrostichi]
MALSSDDIVEIIDLHTRYNTAIDAGDGHAWAATFVEDGAFVRGDDTVAGRAALADFVHAREAAGQRAGVHGRRHWNAAIAPVATTQGAESTCDLALTGRDAENRAVVMAAGGYADELVRVEGTWLFSRRVLTLADM